MNLQQQEQQRSESVGTMGIVLPFTAIHRNMLALVGGKGANLGEMAGAGLPVPPGFCITTAAYEQVASEAGLEAVLDARAGNASNPEQLAELAQAARACIQNATIPEHVAASIADAYRFLGEGSPIPVAVRSSATAEDLPFASFAGQQDTSLNVVGTEAVLDAVRRGFASLWTDRAVSYRASLGLDQRRVQLAVVVQCMVEADAAGKLWLTRSRPITTLYPLPAHAPDNDDELRVYFSLNVFQGVFRPFTPMCIAAFRLIGSTVAGLFDLPPRDPLSGPSILVESGLRLFFDVTAALRTKIGRRLLIGAMGFAEARSGVLFQQLTADPRLSLKPMPRWRVIRAFGSLAAKTRAPLHVIQALFKPSTAVERIQRARAGLEALRATSPQSNAANPIDRLKALEQLIPGRVGPLFRTFPSTIGSGLGSLGLASRLLKGIATPDELQIALRALPHNPTTEMDLDLWALSRRVAADAIAARHVSETAPEQLAQEYRAGMLPPTLQQRLAEFLHHYGHRGVAEIDLGLPRWREDPMHILGVLANYLQLKDPALAPDVQFRRGAQEAEAMVVELTERASRRGFLRGKLAGFFLSRARALAGLREMPKFCLILLLAYMREVLQSVGKELAEAGRLESGEDIFFITLQEAHAALAGEDMREIVRERRAGYEHELQRRHVPRVLLSDGTEPTPAVTGGAESQGMLRGTPASPGSVTGRARVILDPTGAYLEPGEILVAPSTDPGWTPLFLTAGGLVMEMGGANSHGAVVAREYGIPAVVGVANATSLITTGQQLTVDGSRGLISTPTTDPTAF